MLVPSAPACIQDSRPNGTVFDLLKSCQSKKAKHIYLCEYCILLSITCVLATCSELSLLNECVLYCWILVTFPKLCSVQSSTSSKTLAVFMDAFQSIRINASNNLAVVMLVPYFVCYLCNWKGWLPVAIEVYALFRKRSPTHSNILQYLLSQNWLSFWFRSMCMQCF